LHWIWSIKIEDPFASHGRIPRGLARPSRGGERERLSTGERERET